MVLDNLFVITGLSCPFSLPGNGFRFPALYLSKYPLSAKRRVIGSYGIPPQYGHLKALSAIPGLFLYIPLSRGPFFRGVIRAVILRGSV